MKSLLPPEEPPLPDYELHKSEEEELEAMIDDKMARCNGNENNYCNNCRICEKW